MVSTSFNFGERSKIADAYVNMYAPKRLNESCCGSKCSCKGGVTKKTIGKLPRKHSIPAKTGSKLGPRKVLPFAKRDAVSSAKKFTPKVKKVTESAKYYCIADGDRVLCTTDIGESYFNKGGICGETRIYESKIDAMKDIAKVKKLRNPNTKYKVRTCKCVGESMEFAYPSGHPVNEGLWDGIKNIGKGALNVVGGAAKGLGNLAQGKFKEAGQNLWNDTVVNGLGNIGKGALQGTVGTAADVVSGVGNVAQAAGQAMTGDLSGAENSLKAAGTNALGMLSDDAREADVGGAIAKGAGAIGNAALQGAKAVGNMAKAPLNVAGGMLKGAGELAQGNFVDAGKAVMDGASGAVGDIANAGKNMLNAVTNSNGQPQQGAGANGGQPQGGLTRSGVNNGGTGNGAGAGTKPLSLTQQKIQQHRQRSQESVTPKTVAGMTPDQQQQIPDLKKQMEGINNAVNGQQPQQPQQGAGADGGQQTGAQNGGADKSAQRAEIEKQIAALQQKLQSLA